MPGFEQQGTEAPTKYGLSHIGIHFLTGHGREVLEFENSMAH